MIIPALIALKHLFAVSSRWPREPLVLVLLIVDEVTNLKSLVISSVTVVLTGVSKESYRTLGLLLRSLSGWMRLGK